MNLLTIAVLHLSTLAGHPSLSISPPSLGVAFRRPAPWKCKICGRILGSREDHVTHIDAHWGERLRRPDRGRGVDHLWTIWQKRSAAHRAGVAALKFRAQRLQKSVRILSTMYSGWGSRAKVHGAQVAQYNGKLRNYGYRVSDFNRRYGRRRLPRDTYNYALRVRAGLQREKMNLDMERGRLLRDRAKLERERQALLAEKAKAEAEARKIQQEKIRLEKERQAMADLFGSLTNGKEGK